MGEKIRETREREGGKEGKGEQESMRAKGRARKYARNPGFDIKADIPVP